MPSIQADSIILSDKIDKPLEDNRQYKYFKLNNKMQVLLVSDAKADKAAACMAVQIGSLFDDMRCQGLAHFLEHMLFLGTEKYPREDAYNEYLAKHGGMSNAYTSNTQTVYYFNVAKDHLHGALDRFSQFFLHPLFTETATDRELQAVHSEHTKNMQSDGWRMNQLLKNSVSEDHPLNRFTTGNLETLVEHPKKHDISLREKLLEFHKKWYSSNIMTLSILGHESLEDLEKMCIDLFSSVENKEVTVPYGNEIGVGIEPIRKDHLMTSFSVVPVKECKSATFHFKVPEQWMHWKSKPSRFFSHLIGHEGKGSLFSVLKKENLATELCAGLALDDAGLCLFSVDIHLTEKGQDEKNIALVGEMLFSYINILEQERQAILSERAKNNTDRISNSTYRSVFDEMKRIDAMGFKFRSLPDPMTAVMSLATSLQKKEVPAEKVMSGGSLMWEYDEDKVLDFLKELKIENLQLIRVSDKYEKESNEEEHWYGTKHSKVIKLSDDLINQWSKPRDGIKEWGLELFNENPFIAENLGIKEATADSKIEKYPTKYVLDSIADVKTGTGMSYHVFHKQDTTFKLPKMHIALSIYSPYTAESIKNQLLTEMWCQSLSEELNEFAYDAECAGLSYKLSSDSRGVMVEFGGYDDKLGTLLNAVVGKMVALKEIKSSTWGLVSERMDRDLKNASTKRQPYAQAMTIHRRFTCKDAKLYGEKYEIFKELSRSDCDNLNMKVFGQPHHAEGLIMGNVKREETRDLLVKNFVNEVTKLSSTASQGNVNSANLTKVPNQESIFLKPGKHLHARFKGTHDEELNGSAKITLQIGKTSVPIWMMTSLYSQITSQKFFDQLRTKDQLGYIVASQPNKTTEKSEILFLVQSEKKPSFCMERMELFINSMQNEYFGSRAVKPENVEKYMASAENNNPDGNTEKDPNATNQRPETPEAKTIEEAEEQKQNEGFNPRVFIEYRDALINQLEETPKKLAEEFMRHWILVRERTDDFSRRERSIQFLKDLKYSDFLQFARDVGLEMPSSKVEVCPNGLWEEESSISIPVQGRGSGENTKHFRSVEEIDAFLEDLGDHAEWLDTIVDIDQNSTSKMSKL